MLLKDMHNKQLDNIDHQQINYIKSQMNGFITLIQQKLKHQMLYVDYLEDIQKELKEFKKNYNYNLQM